MCCKHVLVLGQSVTGGYEIWRVLDQANDHVADCKFYFDADNCARSSFR